MSAPWLSFGVLVAVGPQGREGTEALCLLVRLEDLTDSN